MTPPPRPDSLVTPWPPRWWPSRRGEAKWQLLAERPSAGAGAIQVYENQLAGDRLYVEGEALQSHALPGGESVIPYVRAIRDLLRLAGARRIAVLGGAGGTLATMMARRGGAASCVLVDPNPDAFALAREYFWLSPRVDCVVADACDYLERLVPDDAPFDAIVLDAYDHDGEVPAHLMAPDFFRVARRRLAPQGLIVANAFADHGADALPDLLGAAMAASGLPITIIDGGEDEAGPAYNALVLAGRFYAGWLPLPSGTPAGIWKGEEQFRHCRAPGPATMVGDPAPSIGDAIPPRSC